MRTAILYYVAYNVKVRQPTVIIYVIDFGGGRGGRNNVSKTAVAENLHANCTFEYFGSCV
jgi:hypothetical protein